jgi:O-antigen/teichoic acid export membrane protein
VLGATQQGLPIILATIFTSLLEVSVFAIYNMVIKGIAGILGIFINNLFPSFGDLIASKNIRRLQQAYMEFEVFYYMMISWVFTCLFVLVVPFVKLFTLGIEDISYNRPMFAFLIILNCLMYNVKVPQGMLVQSAGLFRATRLQTSIQLVIAILASCALAPIWGLNGIVVGMLISNAYRAVDLAFYIPRYVTNLSPWRSIVRMLRVFLCVILSVAPFCWIKVEPLNYWDWCLSAGMVSCISITIILCISIIFDGKVLLNIWRRIVKGS